MKAEKLGSEISEQLVHASETSNSTLLAELGKKAVENQKIIDQLFEQLDEASKQYDAMLQQDPQG